MICVGPQFGEGFEHFELPVRFAPARDLLQRTDALFSQRLNGPLPFSNDCRIQIAPNQVLNQSVDSQELVVHRFFVRVRE